MFCGGFWNNKRIGIKLSHKTTSSVAKSLSEVIVKGNLQSPLARELIRVEMNSLLLQPHLTLRGDLIKRQL